MQNRKGSKQVRSHRKLQSLPPESASRGSGVAELDSKSFQSGSRSSTRPFGTPIKKLLAAEMTGETDSKRRAPGVIARLMGLDGLPPQLPKKHKDSSENHLKKTAQVAKTRTLYDGGSSRRSAKDQLEYKDVFEVSEIPKVESSRYPSQGSADLKITDAEMSFGNEKFVDAKRFASYQDLQSSQDSHDAHEILDSENGLQHKYFKRPDSLFKKHLDDLQGAPLRSNSGPREAKKLSNIEKYELGEFSWKSGREMTGLNYNSSRERHDDGFSCDFDRRHAMHNSPKSPKLQFKGIDEPVAVPTRIVILKPNLGKVLSATKIVSSPHSSHDFQSQCGKHAGFPDVRFRGIDMNQKEQRSTAMHSRKKSSEYRKVAKEITSQMKKNLDNGSMLFSSPRFRGYTWDDSLCDFSGTESIEESDVTTATLGNTFDKSNTPRSSSRCSESSMAREAKKRISKRWEMSLKSQKGQSMCRSSTLAEMLAVPDKDLKPTNVNNISCGKSFHDKHASSGKPAGWVEPVGISSRDGWKDEFIGILPRSKSLPASSTAFGSPRTIMRHEALRDDRYLTPIKWERRKAVKCLDHQRQCVSTRSSKSGHKKSWSSHSSNIEGNESSSPEISTIHNEVKINLEEDFPKQEVLAVESFAEILRDASAVTFNVVDVANENAAGLSESSDKVLLPELSSCVLTKAKTNDVDKDNLLQQELSLVSSNRNSASFRPPVPRLESSSSKDANQPSPISVLKSSVTDDMSPCSECFESLSVDLQGLRMQLQLLKLESGEHVEGSALASYDEDGEEASPGILEDQGLHRTEDSWEYCYLIDALSEAGIDIAQPEEAFLEVLHSPECPINPSVFDELEKRYSYWTICSRSERRLLFDRINSALVNVHEKFISGRARPWASPGATSLCFKLFETGLQDYLYSILGSEGKSKDTILEKVPLVSHLQGLNSRDDDEAITREVESLILNDLGAEQWFNLRDEVDVVAREIQSLLLDDIVAEITST